MFRLPAQIGICRGIIYLPVYHYLPVYNQSTPTLVEYGLCLLFVIYWKLWLNVFLYKHPILGIFVPVENDQVSSHCSSLTSSRKKDDEIGEGKRERERERVRVRVRVSSHCSLLTSSREDDAIKEREREWGGGVTWFKGRYLYFATNTTTLLLFTISTNTQLDFYRKQICCPGDFYHS